MPPALTFIQCSTLPFGLTSSAGVACELNPVFIAAEYKLPSLLISLYGADTVMLLPVQLHGIVYGLFASLVAPFGGFMASAIKRAYGIKDFENFFPGHGGLMDRMDCQLLMLSFTYVHLYTFIVTKVPTLKNMLLLAMQLSLEDQQKLYTQLGGQIMEQIASGTLSP